MKLMNLISRLNTCAEGNCVKGNNVFLKARFIVEKYRISEINFNETLKNCKLLLDLPKPLHMRKFLPLFAALIFSLSLITGNAAGLQDTNKKDEQGRKQGYWVITGSMKATPGFKPDQVIEEGNYLDDKKNGLWKAYYANGNKKSEIEYKNNKPNGKYVTYYENGKTEEEGTWKNNANIGSFKRWHPNGVIAQEKTMNTAGKPEGTITYTYPNGKKEMEFTASNGVEQGKLTRWYPNGDVMEEMTFNGGKVDEATVVKKEMVNPPVVLEEEVKTAPVDPNLKANEADVKVKDGYNKLYDDQKRLVQDGEFKGGKLWNGKHYKYDKNGLLLKIEMYKEGKYVGDGQID